MNAASAGDLPDATRAANRPPEPSFGLLAMTTSGACERDRPMWTVPQDGCASSLPVSERPLGTAGGGFGVGWRVDANIGSAPTRGLDAQLLVGRHRRGDPVVHVGRVIGHVLRGIKRR